MMWRSEDAAGLEADDDRGLDIFLRALHQHEAVGEPGEFRPPHDQHGDDGVGRADAERGRDGQRQDDRRKAQHEIGEAHDQLFAAPAHKAAMPPTSVPKAAPSITTTKPVTSETRAP